MQNYIENDAKLHKKSELRIKNAEKTIISANKCSKNSDFVNLESWHVNCLYIKYQIQQQNIENERWKMSFDEVILWIMAVGLIIGGIDKILGNRLGLGEKFDEGFKAMGPLALGMVGIVCLTPIILNVIQQVISPLFVAIHIDPAMIGSVLANDMGGYPLSMELALDERVGLLSGTIVASMLGAVLVFHIPVGLGLIDEENHPYFAKGLLIGMITIPVGSILGGLTAKFPVGLVVKNMIPVIVLSILLAIGLKVVPQIMIKGSLIFGKLVTAIIYIGLMCAAFEHITGFVIIPGMTPITEGMGIVAGIAIVLAGTFPVLSILMRVLNGPLTKLGKKIGLDSISTAALIFALANSVPVFTMMKSMKKKGIVVNTAWAITIGAAFGDHLGFTASVRPDMIGPMIVGKTSAGILAVALALLIQKREETRIKAV